MFAIIISFFLQLYFTR